MRCDAVSSTHFIKIGDTATVMDSADRLREQLRCAKHFELWAYHIVERDRVEDDELTKRFAGHDAVKGGMGEDAVHAARDDVARAGLVEHLRGKRERAASVHHVCKRPGGEKEGVSG